jgi:hypothetical protein
LVDVGCETDGEIEERLGVVVCIGVFALLGIAEREMVWGGEEDWSERAVVARCSRWNPAVEVVGEWGEPGWW